MTRLQMKKIKGPISIPWCAVSAVVILMTLAGCARPDLIIRDLEVNKYADPADPLTVLYRFVVENRDYSGNLFVRPTPARGEIYVQSFLSSDGVAKDGAAAGGFVLVPQGESLPVGGRKNGSFGGIVTLKRETPFLIATVGSRSQSEYNTANNSMSRLIDPTPPSDLEQWLREHPSVKRNMWWQTPGGNVVLFQDWDNAMKTTLQQDINSILSGNPQAVPDPPPLAYVPADGDPASTTFTVETARSIYLMHAARSIVSEQVLPWSLSELRDDGLSVLFNSRSLFSWDSNLAAYRVVFGSQGSATPGDPNSVFAFLKVNGLIANSRQETINRVLDWARHLQHNFGYDTAANYFAIWQYRGMPPVSRILSGTTDTNNPSYGKLHYTAGCFGTSALLSFVLRTVNIPVKFGIYTGHAHPNFVHERTFLSHGDDPYNVHMKTGPWIPMAELPISETTHRQWFGPTVSPAEQANNTGRRVAELVLKYLSGQLVLSHCQDLAEGVLRENSRVFTYFSRWYTMEALDAANLWSRLDQKAIELGYCTP